tara:strand:+ start:739 stop:1482 length:744 start_codon:yes stop_codon:yes gene_type:complete
VIVNYPTYNESCTIELSLFSDSSSEFQLLVEDADDDNIVFTNRSGKLSGNKKYYVRLPIAPENALIEVTSKNDEVEIDDIKILDLPTNMDSKYFNNPEVKSFVNFAEEFSYNASTLTANNTKYTSDDNIFSILYLDAIVVDGKVDPTPARISQVTGLIEVSKKDFLEYTIPMRMAILLHEFSHYYLNDIMEDEIEADRHSLSIYMALGYPRIDAYNVYLDVFTNAPTELNKERYQALNKLFNQEYIK